MLIDLHAHSSGISRCCKKPIEDVLSVAVENDIDGVVLTNHYLKNYVADGDYVAFARRYMDECKRAIALGKERGIPVFWGIELTPEYDPRVHLLIYGVPWDFIEKNATLFDADLAAIYRTVHAAGGILVQAHPFRNGATVQDTRFLDGVEINCHPRYAHTYSRELSDIAADGGLILTCGGDYHADWHRPKCGVYLPDDIEDSVALKDYLLSAESLRLCVNEIEDNTLREVHHRRKK